MMWAAAWTCWLLIFVIFESVALLRVSRGDTFTENFRRWFRLETSRRNRISPARLWIIRAIVITFGTWLTTHMAFGWFGGGEGFMGG